jgi:predicted esterase YcpF (UPF0227 family)
MKKILYLHGLESNQGGPKVSFLASKGMIYAPSIDYKTLDLHEFIYTIGMPDLIIGSSMGGYAADIIGSHLGVDVLLFNPALHSRSLELNKDYGVQNYKRTIVLGMEDTLIDPSKTKMLSSVGGNVTNIIEIKDMGHRTPFNVFVDMYNKHA